MTYSFYPGCALEASSVQYNQSTRAVCQALEIELVELEDWNCCGATAYMSVRELRSFALAARNLALAERAGWDLVTVCSACYTVLNKTNRYLAENGNLRNRIGTALAAAGLEYHGTVQVRHLLEVLVNDIGPEAIAERAQGSLQGLKVAPYYGCQITRPYSAFDDPDFPTSLDTLFASLDAEIVPYALKTKCCGGMLMTTNEEIALKLVKNLLQCAAAEGAECLVTTCPLCYVNLDSYQGKISRQFGAPLEIPVLFFTQLLGVALGLPAPQLGLDKSIVPAQHLLAKYLPGSSEDEK
ncbi:MAG TPA: disulfide reductase [Armatimonadetes bacterium]|nr:disulfide reductase [Armatimonadota bacterium]